jgi:hypothetical protein
MINQEPIYRHVKPKQDTIGNPELGDVPESVKGFGCVSEDHQGEGHEPNRTHWEVGAWRGISTVSQDGTHYEQSQAHV